MSPQLPAGDDDYEQPTSNDEDYGTQYAELRVLIMRTAETCARLYIEGGGGVKRRAYYDEHRDGSFTERVVTYYVPPKMIRWCYDDALVLKPHQEVTQVRIVTGRDGVRTQLCIVADRRTPPPPAAAAAVTTNPTTRDDDSSLQASKDVEQEEDKREEIVENDDDDDNEEERGGGGGLEKFISLVNEKAAAMRIEFDNVTDALRILDLARVNTISLE